MTDRVKETIFNILGSRLGTLSELPAVHVLDLFAGTGGLGIEALSRGAQSCIFFERDRHAMRCLRANIETLGLTNVAHVAISNAWTTRFSPPPGGFGLVFVDPPYPDVEDATPAFDLLERIAMVLSPTAIVVFRHEFRIAFPKDRLRGLVCVDEREIGRMKLLFLEVLADREPNETSSEDQTEVRRD